MFYDLWTFEVEEKYYVSCETFGGITLYTVFPIHTNHFEKTATLPCAGVRNDNIHHLQ